MPSLPQLDAVRYLQPLREGGSLPAVVDTATDGLWVVKFRGAGQGAKVLISELIVGGIARALGLPVPDLGLVTVSERFGRSEPDSEIQELLRRSHGVNVGLRFLEGAFNFEAAAAGDLISPELAALIVWLDAFTTNPDRTARNPNLLIWNRAPWLIDHGAALYAHHDWASVDAERTRRPFALVRSHVLLRTAGDLRAADAHAATHLNADVLEEIVATVPDELLMDTAAGTGDFPSAAAARARYTQYLAERFEHRAAFVADAETVKAQVMSEPPQQLKARR